MNRLLNGIRTRAESKAGQSELAGRDRRGVGHGSDASSGTTVEVTMPQLLLENHKRWPDRVWMRKKDKGIWNEYTWRHGYEQVKYLSLGLMVLGLSRGENIAILGDNDPHWFWAELAAQAAGAAVLGIFSSSSAPEVRYLAELCDATFLIVQDQEQVDKVLAIKDQLPLVRRVLYWESKGMRNYDDPALLSFEEVMVLGRKHEEASPHLFEESVGRIKAEDLAVIIPSSGTTGMPKALMVTSSILRRIMAVSHSLYEVCESDDWVSFVLPGYSVEQCLGLFTSLEFGCKLNFPESVATVQEDLREISPQIIYYPSRLWEGIASSIQNSITESFWLDKVLYKLCLQVGYRKADAGFDGRELALFWKPLYMLCSIALFNPLRDRHGLRRTRVAFTGGAALGPDTFRLISAVGVDLRQTYGCSEHGVGQHTAGNVKVDSVGVPYPGTTIRIARDGELLARGNECTTGYYKNPEATQKAFAGGWMHTGDALFVDEDGHLHYLDRVEYMRELADGTRYAPQYIESRLKFSSFIKDAFVVGDKTDPFIGVVLEIDFENVGNWAEKRGIPYTTFADLSQKPEVTALVRMEVEKVNAGMPGGLKVRRFVNTPKAFDPDESELTRTMKLRRGFMEDRYKGLIAAIYGENEEVMTETEVIYRDGRKRVMSTRLRVIRM